MEKKTPLAFFAYNRPTHTKRALEALTNCSRFDEVEIYIYSDGPISGDASSGVHETRKVLRDWAETYKSNLIEQSQNLGLAKAIVNGVSELCARYGRVIVVEDDLVVSPDFLHYMIETLDHYEKDENVMQVGGCTISAPRELTADVFLLPVTTTWGWATWQRSWQHFSWQPEHLEAARHDSDWKKLFDLNGTCAFTSMLEDRLAGKNNSWGILWWYVVSRRRGLVAYPAQSLVWNGGFDGTGIHCGSSDFLQQSDASLLGRSNYLPNSLRYPLYTKVIPENLLRLEDFFRSKLESHDSKKTSKGLKQIILYLSKKYTDKIRNAFC
ncbi:glycosyltransferase [uncultured Desulfobulbus sp.]|uniref:glycosyltransferase n=1 Tax=uncultured Desulfobulbus sp. TaxID=239745 RepID=UPI0029C97E91|nr:glycosyltransferase [uncultured Desulfobulbus sp.]